MKNKQLYAEVALAREYGTAVGQARDFAVRFPESEGFELKLYRWENNGTPVDFNQQSS